MLEGEPRIVDTTFIIFVLIRALYCNGIYFNFRGLDGLRVYDSGFSGWCCGCKNPSDRVSLRGSIYPIITYLGSR